MRNVALKSTLNVLLAPVFVMLMVTASEASESYQYSIEGSYDNTELSDDVDLTTLTGTFNYFLAPVSYQSGPYNEASFLDRQTRIAGGLGTAELDAGGVDIDGTAAYLAFYYADQSSPVTFGLAAITISLDDTIVGNDVEFTLDSLVFQIGYYITNHSGLALVVEQQELEAKENGVLQGESDIDATELLYKNVMTLGDNRFVNLEAGLTMFDYENNNENTELFVLGDYYLDKKTSVRGGLAVNSGDDNSAEGNTLTLGGTAFLSKTAALTFEYEQFSSDQAGGDTDSISITFESRFN